ncbi:MAG: outer membrane lipoprotein carrier protein LolA [Bacteroidales bacterium]|jgi:outer membrane lipoprotein-sorting protein|nr:outer membrane lipoprotein carrier protein LolA [Bacteroidales bacterium]
MKKLLLIILIALFSLSIYAQHDDIAKKILEKVSSKTKSYTTISADFTVKFSDLKDNNSNTSKGNIILKGDNYLLNFMNSTSYFNGVTLWSYLKDVNEVNISEPSNDDDDNIFSHPNKIFTIYEGGFKYKYLGEINKNNITYYSINLFPENLEEEYSKISLEINKTNLRINSAKIFNKNGTRYFFSISNYIVNKQIADSTFTFDKEKFPNVEVIDLRW